MHQPFGSMVPDTILQAFGGSQFTQVLHLAPSLGVVWYWTIFGSILSWALAATATTLPPTTANPERKTCRRVVLSCLVTSILSFSLRFVMWSLSRSAQA
jgi:hypothetical protein